MMSQLTVRPAAVVYSHSVPSSSHTIASEIYIDLYIYLYIEVYICIRFITSSAVGKLKVLLICYSAQRETNEMSKVDAFHSHSFATYNPSTWRTLLCGLDGDDKPKILNMVISPSRMW